MSKYVITLLAAAAVTYILTPAVRRFAIAVGAMHAARERDVHELPTPLLGARVTRRRCPRCASPVSASRVCSACRRVRWACDIAICEN